MMRRSPDLEPAESPAALRRAFSCFPSGVVAVCAHEGGSAFLGMAASSFSTVSLDPPLVSVCVQNTSTTWPRLRARATVGGAAAHLSCGLHAEFPGGDHLVVLLRIRSLAADPQLDPLVFHASTFRTLRIDPAAEGAVTGTTS